MSYLSNLKAKKQAAIATIINQLGENPITAAQFVEPLGMQKTHIQAMMCDLEKEGKCVSIQTLKGTVGKLRKYYLAADVSQEVIDSVTKELNVLQQETTGYRDFSALSPELARMFGYKT